MLEKNKKGCVRKKRVVKMNHAAFSQNLFLPFASFSRHIISFSSQIILSGFAFFHCAFTSFLCRAFTAFCLCSFSRFFFCGFFSFLFFSNCRSYFCFILSRF